MNPDMFKEFPPEISGADELVLSLDSGNPGKHLFRCDRAFDFLLRISHDVELSVSDLADSMHNKLTAGPLIKYDLPHCQRRIRLAKENRIPLVGQKGRHGTTFDYQTDLMPLLGQFPEHGYISCGIKCFHMRLPFDHQIMEVVLMCMGLKSGK